ncbi:type II toxin-antitoxin system RelE family toxin [Exiguobacterium sp. TDN 0502]|uniref:type II toxin-antitoxin system RelE family toxin n=1 Tax=Exiguobacterium sp. TDN 0502 TaxID=3420731 RepID=UPI003D77D0E7
MRARGSKISQENGSPTSAEFSSWIKKNLVGTDDPRRHGKGLVSNRSGEWRYRIGDYRLIAYIQDEKVIILILEIGHRRGIYK